MVMVRVSSKSKVVGNAVNKVEGRLINCKHQGILVNLQLPCPTLLQCPIGVVPSSPIAFCHQKLRLQAP